MTPKNMGPRIKRLRERQGMTQAELAKAIQVSRVHLANLESPDAAPHHRNPSLPTTERLAKALKVSVGQLLGERPTPRKGKP